MGEVCPPYRPGIPLEQQSGEDLTWIRARLFSATADHGARIVYGHAPVAAITHFGTRLALDTGVGCPNARSAVAIEGRKVWLLTEAGRVAVDPA